MRGDQTITAFANLLRVQTRESDILSRLGGDEFVVIMKQMKSGESAVRKGEDICRSISEYPFDDKVLACCSAGVVIWDTRKPLSSILECADQALYRAKAEKKEAAACGKTGMNVYRNQAAFGANMIIRIKSGLYRRGFRVRYPGPFPVYGNI